MADRGVYLDVDEVSETTPGVEPVVALVDTTPTANIPLTDGQKLLLRSYQNKLTTLAKQKSDIDVQVARVEGAMQVDMIKIALTNKIDPEKFGFNDNLEIIPAQPPGTRRAPVSNVLY
jgi:hypothetical protein